MKKILIVVDYQNDFVDPQGALPVPNATEIAENIQREIDSNEFDYVIYTMDTHTPEQYFSSEEQAIFPDIHCDIKTPGWKLFNIKPRNPEIQEKMIEAYNTGKTFVEINNEAMFVKDQFDIWAGNPDWENWFTSNFDKDTKVYISGVATNYCVFMNAMGYIPRGYENVYIISDCVEGIKQFPNGEEDPSFSSSQITMLENGIRFKNSEEV